MALTSEDLARLGPGAQRQILAKLAKPPAASEKRQKYGNRKAKRIMPNGEERTFDSEKEARRYDELALLLKAGRIQNLRLQQDFTLAEAFVKPSGEAVRAERYKADFTANSWQEQKNYNMQNAYELAFVCPNGGAWYAAAMDAVTE